MDLHQRGKVDEVGPAEIVPLKGTFQAPAGEISLRRSVPDSLYEREATLACVMIGQTISHYKITERIGEGGMGEHARISVETRGSPVSLVYAALGLEGEADAPRFSSAASSFGKSLYPFTRRKFFSATRKAEPTQRSM